MHKYARTTNTNFNLVPVTGWGGLAYDIELGFALSNTYTFASGAPLGSIPNPGAADFLTLYDEYRIEGVEVSFLWSNNAVAPGSATPNLPIVNIVFDPSDTSAVSTSTALSYQNVQTVQLGNQRTQNGFVVRCAPVPNVTTPGSGQMIPVSAPWLSIDTPNVVHNAIKFVYDPAGSSLATQIGTLTLNAK